MTGVLMKGGNLDTHTQREDQVETKEKTVIYTSRREASEETNSTNKGTPASGIMRR